MDNPFLYFVPREDDKSIKNGELFESFRGVCHLMEVKQLYGTFLSLLNIVNDLFVKMYMMR